MSGTPYEIPLATTSGAAEPQTFQIALGTVTYTLTFKFNPVSDCWMLDIDNFAGVNILDGLALVTGADLLSQFKYLGIPGQLVVWWVASGQPQAPDFSNLGTEAKLYFIPD